MPRIKQAIKRVKQTEKRRVRNKAIKTRVKTGIKKLNAIPPKDKQKAKEVLRETQKGLDKSVSKGVIKKNKASRLKSRLAKKLNV